MWQSQETRDFFAGTKVVAAIVPREGGTEDSMTQKFTKGNMFTHHQKSVIVDAADSRYAPLLDTPTTLARDTGHVGCCGLSTQLHDECVVANAQEPS